MTPLEPAKRDEFEIRDELARMLRRLLDDPDLEPRHDLNIALAEDLPGWNSFMLVELLIEAQERFRVELSAREVESIETFGDVVAVFARAKAF